METHTPTVGQTLQNALSRPFEPLTLRRPMRLFPTSLGLDTGKPGLPSDDFLTNFHSGRRTHLALIRAGFGKEFKNFQNYALRKVNTTPATRQRLIDALNGNEEFLEVLAAGMHEGKLVAEVAKITRLTEGVLYQFTRTLSSGSLKCMHCQAELVSRPAEWWGTQHCVLGQAEYGFVDRILYDVLGVTLLPLLFGTNWARKEHAIGQLAALCDAGAHPFKHWLDLVRSPYRARDLTALATRARMDGPSPDSLLQRVARGEMLTAETIQEVTESLNDRKPLRKLGMQVRTLAFAMDFLAAADKSTVPVDWQAAQATVRARIFQISQDMRLSLAQAARPAPASSHQPLQ